VLPGVAVGPGTGAKPQAAAEANRRAGAVREASPDTGMGGTTEGDRTGGPGSLVSSSPATGRDDGSVGVRADGMRGNQRVWNGEARHGPATGWRERPAITGEEPGSAGRPCRESEPAIVPSAPRCSITPGEGRAGASGCASEGRGTCGTGQQPIRPPRPQGRERVRELQRKLYRAAKADSRRTFGVLYDKVYRRDVLEEAWRRVKEAGGGPGADERSLKDIEADGVERFLDEIQASLQQKDYRPDVVLRRYIPKPGKPGQVRPLGLPTVRDKVVQMAMKIVLEPIFEADFLPCSYGFRPRRSAHDALRDIRNGMWRQGRLWIVDLDLKSYFDSIPHDKLLKAVERRIHDTWVLRLIRRWLKAGILDEGVVHEPESGTPQGGVLSPVLANLYLHAVDAEWLRRGQEGIGGERFGHWVRYADDAVILCRTEDGARRALDEVRSLLAPLGLRMNQEKTRLVQAREGFDFLGFHLRWVPSRRTMRHFVLWRPSRRALRNIRERLRQHARRVHPGEDASVLITRLNRSLVGWANYFRPGHASTDFRKVDQHARTQVRLWFRRKQRWWRGSGVRRYPAAFLHDRLGLVQLVRSGVALSRLRPNTAGEARRRAGCGKTARPVR
jgi:RNA-directed DNA polymerase